MRITDIQNGAVNWNTVPYCKCDELEKYRLSQGDILFARTGATTGKSYLISTPPEAVFASYLIRLKPTDKILPEFLFWYFQSSSYWHAVYSGTEDSNRPNMNGTKLAKLEIPFPRDKAYQKKIVKHFETVQAKAEQLRRLQAETEADLEKFMPSLLAKAFRGELVESEALVSPSKPKVITPKRTKGIAFKRGAVAAYLVDKLHYEPTFGRTKLEKLNHLIEYHIGIDLERKPIRDAAGPNDYSALRRTESLAQKRGWFYAQERRGRMGTYYLPGENIGDRVSAASHIFGDKQQAVDDLIILFRKLNSEECAIIATLYASWNDFLIEGIKPSYEQIIDDVTNNWHEEKKQISVKNWEAGLEFIQKHSLVPQGKGRVVKHK